MDEPRGPFILTVDHADLVQEYIDDVLQSVYRVDAKQAREIANLWTIGTGETFRSLPSHAFVEIFGAEAGWVLFKDTQKQLFDLFGDPNETPRCRRCTLLAIVLTLGSALTLLSQFSELRPWLQWVWIIGVAVAFMVAYDMPFSRDTAAKGVVYGLGVTVWMRFLPVLGVDPRVSWPWEDKGNVMRS